MNKQEVAEALKNLAVLNDSDIKALDKNVYDAFTNVFNAISKKYGDGETIDVLMKAVKPKIVQSYSNLKTKTVSSPADIFGNNFYAFQRLLFGKLSTASRSDDVLKQNVNNLNDDTKLNIRSQYYAQEDVRDSLWWKRNSWGKFNFDIYDSLFGEFNLAYNYDFKKDVLIYNVNVFYDLEGRMIKTDLPQFFNAKLWVTIFNNASDKSDLINVNEPFNFGWDWKLNITRKYDGFDWDTENIKPFVGTFDDDNDLKYLDARLFDYLEPLSNMYFGERFLTKKIDITHQEEINKASTVLNLENYVDADHYIKSIMKKFTNSNGLFVNNQLKFKIKIRWDEFIGASDYLRKDYQDVEFLRYLIDKAIENEFYITLYNKALFQGFSIGALLSYFAIKYMQYKESNFKKDFNIVTLDGGVSNTCNALFRGVDYTPEQYKKTPQLNPYLAKITVKSTNLDSGFFHNYIGCLDYGEFCFSKQRDIDNMWFTDSQKQLDIAYENCKIVDDSELPNQSYFYWDELPSTPTASAPAQSSISSYLGKSKFNPKAKKKGFYDFVSKRTLLKGDVGITTSGELIKMVTKNKQQEIDVDDWTIDILNLDKEELLVALDKLEKEKQNLIDSRIVGYEDLDDEELINSYESLQNEIINKIK